MNYASLVRYALVGAFLLAGVSLAQAQHLAPEDAEELGIEQAVERPAEAPAVARGGLQVCVDDVLLVPDASLDGVAVFDPATGDLVDPAFIVNDTLSTPINAIANFNGDGIFVSDQIEDAVFEFDCNGDLVRLFAPAGGVDNTILNNVRGISLSPDGTQLLVSTASGDNAGAIAAFDTDGNYVGNFIEPTDSVAQDPFDVLVRDSDVLYADIDLENIQQFDLSGNFLAPFVDSDGITGLDFPEQMNSAANGNLLVAGFSLPSGAYEYDAAGTQVGYYDVKAGLRGIYELPNGNLLVTNGGGISEITRANTLVRDEYAEADRFIELFKAPAAGDPIKTSCSGPASVPQGGQATFTYQVCNNTDNAVSGVAFYNVFRNANQVRGPVQIASGNVQAMSCTPNLSFSVNVPNAAPVGDYDVSINAGPANGTSVSECVVSVAVTANARPDGAATTWSLVEADPWPTLEAAATTAVDEVSVFPNPLRASATIQYQLAEDAEVRLAVYDVLGRTIAVLAEGRVEAGTHAATFDARGLSAGTYVYRLQVGDTVQTGRLTVLY